jgi:hypothetical protein
MEQLQDLREPASSPGGHSARQHLESCVACQDELDRVHQMAAQLKALPVLRPPRDRWPQVRAQMVAQRRWRRAKVIGISGLAMAASMALFLVGTATTWRSIEGAGVAQEDIATAMAQSQLLEKALDRYRPARRVTDGQTATVVAGLEGRIAEIDRRLQVVGMTQQQSRNDALLRLWRQRVGLMDVLVSVHLTRATNAGL